MGNKKGGRGKHHVWGVEMVHLERLNGEIIVDRCGTVPHTLVYPLLFFSP